MKKLGVILLVLVLSLSTLAFVGCGDKNNEVESGSSVLLAAESEAEASAAESNGTQTSYYTYEAYGKEGNRAYIITGLSKAAPATLDALVIPDVYGSRPVIGIKRGAFRDNKTITSVTMGDNMQIIGTRSFCGASKLATVTFGANVNKISAGAFRDCTSLESISIPAKVSALPGNAFSGCSKLKSVTFNVAAVETTDKKGNVTTANKYLLNDIGPMCFFNCTALESMDLSKLTELSVIGSCVFKGCTSLEKVVLPEKISSLPIDCFTFCESLSDLTFEGTITTVNVGAFYGCSSLTDADLDDAEFKMLVTDETHTPEDVAKQIRQLTFKDCPLADNYF